MSSFRTAIRFFSVTAALALPITASAVTFDVKALIDTDNRRTTGCSVVTVGGIVDGIDMIVTTTGNFTGTTANVTGVTRQTCLSPGGTLFSSPTAVDGGWNVGVSPIGDLTIESHVGPDVITRDNVRTPRFVFTTSAGLLSDVVMTPFSWGGGDIVMPHAGRNHASASGPPRVIILDGAGLDWSGVVPLAGGSATQPAWRFISSSAYAGPHDFFFNFQIHTNPNAPTAHDDNYALATLGGTLTVSTLGVLNNDNPNGQPITATLVDGPRYGTLTLNPNGGFTYVHDGSLGQQDQFRYVDTGTPLLSNVATVTINLPGNGGGGGGGYQFTSADHVTFQTGVPGSFIVTVTGNPVPVLTETGALPAGITFVDNGNKTGKLSGTPAPGTAGVYHIVFHASNGQNNSDQNFTLTISCPNFTVTNPPVNTGTRGTPFSQTFTQAGGSPPVTFSLNTGTLPTGLTLSTAGVLSGTPTQSGLFPITVKATDSNGCTAVGPTYNLTINCQTITVTNPATTTGTAGVAFSQTFTQSGAIGGATFSLNSGTLPTGFTLSAAGVLSGTTSQAGSFPITVKATDGGGCFGIGATYNLVINCQTVTVTNPGVNTGTVDAPFSQTFTASGILGTATWSETGALPAGITLNASTGVLSGTPAVKGSFPITVKATDSNGCFGTSSYTLTINCQTITVTNPSTTTGTVDAAFSQTFTQAGAHGTATFTTASSLPAGLSLSTAGVLSGAPTVKGTFPIVVTVTDANGCTGTGATYNLVISCQTITVTNPATATGTTNSPFSQTFTQTAAHGTATFTTASTLPAGFSLSAAGVLSGTTQQHGNFPIVVTVTDSNGCTGTGSPYTLIINCQTITVGNPATTSSPAGTPLSINFTQSGALGGATFTTGSTLPNGLSLAANGTLSGTPTQGGAFPISVTVTDGNGCTGTNPSYTLTITCPTITVTNPGVNTGTAGVLFSQTFTQSGGQGTITWSKSGPLPSGITLNSTNGVLSGTTNAVGTFSIFVTATDQNGCTGTGAQYDLTINCQTITVTNPGVNTGTVDAPFSQTFGVSGNLGTVTWSETGPLPVGITLDPGTGVLAGTPTTKGTFPITVKATDTNGCFNNPPSSYTLTINCQTITVTNPSTNTGTVDAPFNQTFSQSGAHGTATFSIGSGSLPAGLTLHPDGVLDGTPTVKGPFSITVLVTDANGCTGTGPTYNLTINCQTITVTNPSTNTGTTGTFFSQQFSQTGGHGTTTFSTLSTLPTGFTLDPSTGILSGTTNQHTNFSIVVVATDSNGCTGTGATYNLTINCQAISITNPVNNTGTVNAPFSEQFQQSGGLNGGTFATVNTLPNGLTLDANTGVLSGTPTQSGTFNIIMSFTDGNGCGGSGPTYQLIIGCNTLNVTNPGVNTGTAGVAFDQAFSQTGGHGTIHWTKTGDTLPAGITLDNLTGHLFGTTNQVGTFNITVIATDANGCTGSSPYSLTINCQTITVTNPVVNSTQAGVAFDQAFTASGILGTAAWSETGDTLPGTLALNPTTGHLAGTANATGTFNIVVKATDTNGCFGVGTTYTLTVTCATITVAHNPAGPFPAGTFNVAYPAGHSVVASGGGGSYTYAITAGGLPTSMSFNTSNGAITGTPSQTGTFTFTITATDTASNCTGSQSFSIAVNPSAPNTSYSNLVNNSQAVVTGGLSSGPAGRAIFPLAGTITSNAGAAPAGFTLTTGTSGTSHGGSVTIASDGTFLYTPPVGTQVGADTFTYTITSNTGSTPTPTQATGTVSLNFNGIVWYVDNTNAGTADGRSNTPFNTLVNAQNASAIGETIYVYLGSGSTGQDAGIVLKNNQIFQGSGSALIFSGHVMQTGTGNGTGPTITNTGGGAVTLADGNTVKGMKISGASGDGISGNGKNGATLDFLTVFSNAGSAVHLVNMTGTVTSTNSTWDDKAATPSSIVLDVSGGSGTISFDISNVFTTTSGRTVSVAGRTGGTITIGANFHENGSGILVNNSAAGSPVINFNTPSAFGSLALNTGANTAFTIQGSTGTPTITISGTLTITTTTGTGFDASGAGNTLNVTGTSNITTGAAGAGLSLNGITIGGSGVTFNSVSTTGATTGINLVSFGSAGTVTVNGGTISNGTTGISLQGTNTSLSLAGVTITGPTTGITNTTNFGTLTIGSSVSVSGVTALSLTTGNLNGTFASLSSTGGTNGVVLTSIGGTGWTATTGTLAGATGAGFKVDGGSANMTYGGSITASGFLVDIGATTGRSGGTITFSSGTLGGTAAQAGSGIRIQSSTGSTFTFSGTQTLGTSLSRMASTAVTLAGNNTSTVFNFSGTMSIFTGAVTAFTATGPTGGTINFSNNDSIDSSASALVLNGVALGAGTLSSVTSAGGTNGISLTTVTGGTLTISGGALSGATGATFLVSGGSVSVTDAGTISQANNQPVVNVAGSHTGTLTLNGAVTATNGNGLVFTSANGTYNIDTGSNALSLNGVDARIILSTSSGTFTFGSVAAPAAITNPVNDAFAFDNSSANVTYNGDITKSGASQFNIVTILNQTGGTVTFQNGTLSSTSTTGTGITLNNADGAVHFNGTTTLNGGNAGVDIITGSSGTFSFSSNTSITNPSGIAYNEDTSTANVTYNGTITKNNNANNAVNINAKTGGTTAFTGSITVSTATANAINLTNTGGTVNFTGGLNLTASSGIAFNASGSGATINVTQNNTTIVNTLTTTSGIALNVANTTIGASGLTFRSVTSNGASNGILLNNTGASGSLTISGNGTACTTSANCTGGSIMNASGAGISLTSTLSPSFDRIFIQNTAKSGISGTQVTNVTITNCRIDNSGTSYPANTDDDSNIGFGFAPGVNPTNNNVSGTVTITGNTLTNAWEHGIDIQNFAGSITDAVITGNTLTSSTAAANTHGSAIRLLGSGSPTTVSNITKALINSNTITNFPGGAGITAQYGNPNIGGPAGVWGTPFNSTNQIKITGNFINGQSAGNPIGANAILMTLTGAGQANWLCDSNGTAGNPISNVAGTEIGTTVRGASAVATCDITNNWITGITSVNAQAIAFAADFHTLVTDAPQLSGIISGNHVSGQDGEAIQALATPGSTAHVDVSIKNNVTTAPNCGGCNRFGITAQVGTSSATTTGAPSMCLDMSGNTAAGSGVNTGIGIRKKTAAYVFNIEGFTGGGDPTSYLTTANPSGGGVLMISQTTGFGNCATAP